MSITETSAAWFEGKTFSTDWTTNKLPHWERRLQEYSGRPIKILELGSFEGRSAIVFLNLLPESHITCVDLFTGPLDAAFDANLVGYGARMEKRKGNVKPILKDLAKERASFDIIYVDAGKKRDHVYEMTLLAWPLLLTNGLIIWDDYQWGKDKPSEERPKDAIDRFVNEHSNDLEIINVASQFFARKITA